MKSGFMRSSKIATQRVGQLTRFEDVDQSESVRVAVNREFPREFQFGSNKLL